MNVIETSDLGKCYGHTWALRELTALRRPLLGWLVSADAAGLDEDGIVALFTSVLRDFFKRRGGSADRPGTADGDKEGVA